MIVQEIKLWNFRKFKAAGEAPGLRVEFHNGLNAIVGENDAGKSAILDAIKMVLQTQSGEYIRVTDDDFCSDDGKAADEFRIVCVLGEFKENEAKNFLECLSFRKNVDGIVEYSLQLNFRAWHDRGRILTELKAGEDENVALESKARELLKCVYLKPLRDAEREMRCGRNSRISQILYSHPVFGNKDDNDLVGIFREANSKIGKYFTEKEGKEILKSVQDALNRFRDRNDPATADFKTSDVRLRSILESLSLVPSEIHPGLGSCNQLFIAAELLLLNHDDNGGLRLALIEEIEAHLHPQAQLRLIAYLQNEYQDNGVQVIISTHSPILASKINVKNVIYLKDNNAYDLSPDRTCLDKGDYLFLQRFLDATKANLFFAKGLIMVEGDAENLVIPTIADILDLNLEQHGVSIVNVGGVAFHRYAKVFLRKDGSIVRLPVSIVTDCDVRPVMGAGGGIERRLEESEKAVNRKRDLLGCANVRVFVAPRWTFEYCLALSSLGWMFIESVLQAEKIANSDKYTLTEEKIKEVENEIAERRRRSTESETLAYEMYHDKMLALGSEGGKPISKAIVAQCFASNLRWRMTSDEDGNALAKEAMFDMDLHRHRICATKKDELKSMIENDAHLKYVVDAIKYATGAVSV